MAYFDDEARAYAAWCLSEVPQKARKTWVTQNRPSKTVSFNCLVKYRDALIGAFQDICPAIQYTVYQCHQYPVIPEIDKVTVDFTWPAGTLRVDYFTTV